MNKWEKRILIDSEFKLFCEKYRIVCSQLKTDENEEKIIHKNIINGKTVYMNKEFNGVIDAKDKTIMDLVDHFSCKNFLVRLGRDR